MQRTKVVKTLPAQYDCGKSGDRIDQDLVRSGHGDFVCVSTQEEKR